jgi:protein-L-isoaspartate O-methyltransferase
MKIKAMVGTLAESRLFADARRLLRLNTADWNYPLTRWQKLRVGVYLILRDYATGTFPPRRQEEQTTFAAEASYYDTLQTLGQTPAGLHLAAMQKPFWFGPSCSRYLRHYAGMQSFLFASGVKPPASLLEVGCGSGWVAEFLAASGFRVLATTLASSDERMLQLRKKGLEARELPASLEFRRSPMEYVHEQVRDRGPFDAVYVYEALHHAHDWRKAIRAFHEVLVPGGWLFIFNEPNLLHTCVSYRVGRLSNTHEVGLAPGALRRHLRGAGFSRVQVLKNRVHAWVLPSWIAARKPGVA